MNPLRKCQYCGLEAYTEEELEEFTKAKRYKYGRRNICKVCFAGLIRKGGKYHEGHVKASKNWYEENKEQAKYNKSRRITFNDKGDYKRIYVKNPPRKGVCSECGFKGFTHIHHDKYNLDRPLENTRELCRVCHLKISNEERRNKIRNGERKGWNIP